jgi:hypothetical protein
MNETNVLESTCCRGLDAVIESAVKQLKNLGYQRGTMRNYLRTWKEFSLFALGNSKENTFSTDLACQFLESCRTFSDKVETGLTPPLSPRLCRGE